MATTKRERQKAARRLKMEAMQKRNKRRQNTRRGIIVAIVAVIVLGTGALLFAGKSPTTTTTTSPPTTVPVTTTTLAKPISFSPVTDPSPVGVWGKQPTLVIPPGAPPTKPELTNLITGTGPGAVDGDKFTAQYVLATYSTRKVVQTSWTSKAGFSDTLEPGALISGWVAGMQGMKVGGRRELILPPAVGYQDTSPGAGIAKNDTLIFIIDLLKLSK
jgi:peptidylprolyl isomerase